MANSVPVLSRFRLSGSAGFSLVELLMVMVIGSGVLLVSFTLMNNTMRGFFSFTSFASMAYKGDAAVAKMSREIREALPNSVRVTTNGSVTALEFLRVVDYGQYRFTQTGAPAAGDPLSFGAADAQFDVLGRLANSGLIDVTGADCVGGVSDCLVIANGVAGADAYSNNNMSPITAIGPASAADGSDQVSFTPKSFSVLSPGQRFYVVDTPVSYLCDTAAGMIRRYDEYTITASQAGVDSHDKLVGLVNPAAYSVLVDDVTACSFTVSTTPPLVSIKVTVSENTGQGVYQQVIHLPYGP